MLKVNLAELTEKGSLPLRARVPLDHPMWADADLGLRDAIEVDFVVTGTATGQVAVRGAVRTMLQRACRRCLEEIRYELEHEIALFFAPVDELSEDRDDEIRPLEPVGTMLDLVEAVREEVILAAPVYTVCRADCKGLCARCGTNLNLGECNCVTDEPDPRWDALRALKND